MAGYLARRVALLALVPVVASYAAWFLGGGLAAALDNSPGAGGGRAARDGVGVLDVVAAAPARLAGRLEAALGWAWAQPPVQAAALLAAAAAVALAACRHRARRDTPRALMRLRPYRTDQASGEQVVAMYDAIGKALLERWWRRLAGGQQAATLRVRCARDGRGVPEARLFLLCPSRAPGRSSRRCSAPTRTWPSTRSARRPPARPSRWCCG